ncbi:MAG: excinuclease ABC subunit UvrC [Spirochaetales bacterium]|nr:excinuclease ABC subunit UvrC [Spirochaetales bacterium]
MDAKDTILYLKRKIDEMPDKPGVYLFKNRKKIIYVGKARSLKKRLKSYFSGEKDIKTQILTERASDIEVIITRNEYEALLLENSLIKQWTPRFNINLKDGKSYPVIRITDERFPRVFRTRHIVFDGSQYFGPFPDTRRIDLYLQIIERYFPLRKCKGKLKKRKHPCLYYHIKRCSAPCCGSITQEEYNLTVDRIRKLLSGKTDDLLHELKKRMTEAAGRMDYERAAAYRDRMHAITHVREVQQVVDPHHEARDYIGYATHENLCTFVVLKYRGGILSGREVFPVEFYSTETEALCQCIIQYYDKIRTLPSAVYLPAGSSDEETLRAYFSDSKGNVRIKIPRKGKHADVIATAEENAREEIEARIRKLDSLKALEELESVLGIGRLPSRIEGFDISHLAGEYTVGSMVSFSGGLADKASYRYFRLRSLGDGKIDDYEALREVVARRYTRVVNEHLTRPDLILVDGGKGQLSSVCKILRALELADIPVIGLAKKNEEIFVPGKENPIILDPASPALRLLEAVRDEAHRFAVGLNRRLRKKSVSHSILENIKGIGRKRSAMLLHTFGSIGKMIEAGPGEVAKAARIPVQKAEEVLKLLESGQEET